MSFHTAVYLFITAGMAGRWSEDIHASLTELLADALYSFSTKMIGFADGTFTLSAGGFITCQQNVSYAHSTGFSLAFADHCFQLLTFLRRQINTILNHWTIPPAPKITDILAFLQH